MKKLFKSLLACVAMLALAIPAQAAVSVVDVGMTNTIVANATTTDNLGNAVLVDNHDRAAFVFKFQGAATNQTGNLTVKISRSSDGTTYETIGFSSTVAANGTNAVVGFVDIPTTSMSSAKYLKVLSIANANADLTVTNCSLQVILKKVK